MIYKKLTVALATGGTGGHIFPAESLAEVLLARGHNPILITDKRFDNRYQGVLATLPTYTITSGSPAGGIVSKIKALIKIGIGVIQVGNTLYETRPDVVVGFGGYPSFPTLFAAINRKFPVIIHEQNAILGRVNKYFAGSASAIATSFHKVVGIPEYNKKGMHYTGNPVREAIIALREQPYPTISENSPIYLLVTGGSLGASVLGEVVPKAIINLPEEIKKRLVITQQCRQNDIEKIQEFYRSHGINVTLATFFNNMPELIAKSHLVISRAGASTVAELAVAGRPAIMIPYPHAMDDHQTKNAHRIAEGGGGWVIPQPDFSAENLQHLLGDILNSPETLMNIAANMKKLGEPEAAAKLADVVELITTI